MVISLSVLGPNIKKLIKGHGGSLPLATLKTCYEAEFEVFIVFLMNHTLPTHFFPDTKIFKFLKQRQIVLLIFMRGMKTF